MFAKNEATFPKPATTSKLRDATGLLKGLYVYFNHFITLKGEVNHSIPYSSVVNDDSFFKKYVFTMKKIFVL